MRIIAKRTLREYWEKYPECREPLSNWYDEVTKAYWENPTDIKRFHAGASILRNGRVVFNIKGNKFRLIVQVNFRARILWIRFIGTHTEYDKINAQNI